MDRCPTEIWERICLFACTNDDGTTGRSLSLVSKYIHNASKLYKLHSIGIHNVDHANSFILFLQSTTKDLRCISQFTISNEGNHMSVDEYIAKENFVSFASPILGRAFRRLVPTSVTQRYNKRYESARRCWQNNLDRDVALLHALVNILPLISPTLQSLDIYFSSLMVPANSMSISFKNNNNNNNLTLPSLTSLNLNCSFNVGLDVTLEDILSSIPVSLPSLKYLDLSGCRTYTISIRSTSELYAHISRVAPSLVHVRIPLEIACKLAELELSPHGDGRDNVLVIPNRLPHKLERVFIQAGPTPLGCNVTHDYSEWARTFAEWDERAILLSPQFSGQHIERCRRWESQSYPDSKKLIPPKLITLAGHTDFISCATFSQDGKFVVSGSGDHTVRVWDSHTGKPTLKPLVMHTNTVLCVAFSPDGKRIVSGARDSRIVIWDTQTGEVVVGPIEGHRGEVSCICFSPDGKRVVSGSEDMMVQVWDTQIGVNALPPLLGHTASVDAVVFSGDGKRINSGSMDTTVIVWDALSGQQQLRLLHGHNNERVVFVAFSPGGSKLVSTSKGGNICVWDVDTGALLSGPSQRHEEDGALTVLFTPHSGLYAISPDGEWVERCLGERERDNPIVQVCDSKTGLFAFTFRVHTARVRSIGFCPDSRRILSTSSDGTVRVCAFDW